MIQIQIPLYPISERTTFSELPRILAAVTDAHQKTEPFPPLFMFQPRPDALPGQVAATSPTGAVLRPTPNPQEVLICTPFPKVAEASFAALKAVEELEMERMEPAQIERVRRAKGPKVKGNTPLKSLFRQMTEQGLTVYSLTMGGDPKDAVSFFFLRTDFTITSFRTEMSKPLQP